MCFIGLEDKPDAARHTKESLQGVGIHNTHALTLRRGFRRYEPREREMQTVLGKRL